MVGSKIIPICVTLIFLTAAIPPFPSAASATFSPPINILQTQPAATNVSPNPSENTAWLFGWSYRVPVAITNPPQDLRDHPVMITLDTETLILDEKLKEDVGDLRFALADGTVLPYLITSGINTPSTNVWVRLPSIPLQGTAIYAYYGNADAVSAENQDAAAPSSSTLVLIDDFSGPAIDATKWDISGANPTIDGGTLRINGDSGWTNQGVNSKLVLDSSTSGYTIEYYQMTTASDVTGGIMSGYGPSPLGIYPGVFHYWAGTSSWFKYVDGSRTQISGRIPDTWYKMEIQLKKGAGYTLLANGNVLADDSSYSRNNLTFTIATYNSGDFVYIDNVVIRRIFDFEPTVVFGDEETILPVREDWLNGWKYRREVVMENPNDVPLADHPVIVNFARDDNMKADLGDIRFTTSDGKTAIPYWIENRSDYAKAWVKLQSIPALGSATIYLYYGKRSASSAENGDAIFTFFDDFKTMDTTKWRQSWPVSDGVVAQGYRNNNLVSIENWPFNNVAVHARVQTDRAAPDPQVRFLICASNGEHPEAPPHLTTINDPDASSAVVIWTGGGQKVGYSKAWDTEWHDIVHVKTGENATGFFDDENVVLHMGEMGDFFVAFRINGGRGNTTLRIDHVFVRKIAEKEPTASVGEAEGFAVDNVAPSSAALQFEGEGYWKTVENLGNGSFTVSVLAVDALGGVENAKLYYRYSLDNWTDEVAWKKSAWKLYGTDNSPQLAKQPLADDFNGTSLDSAKWEHVQDTYGAATFSVEDSKLILGAESYLGSFYNKVYSKETYQYGTLEVRASVPSWDPSLSGEHTENAVYFGFWEYTGTVQAFVYIHPRGSGVRFYTKGASGVTQSKLPSDFNPRENHTYAIEWEPGRARLHVDGKLALTHTTDIPSIPLRAALFAWSNSTGSVSKLEVDRIRVTPAYRVEWEFKPEKYGYYEFMSVATDSFGNVEDKGDAFRDNLAEANVRVAKDLVRVAVILAEPSDNPHNENQTWAYFKENTVDYLMKYYDEVSYGALALRFSTSNYNKNNNWYKIGPSSDYDKNPRKYTDDSIIKSAGDFDYNVIDIAVVVPILGYKLWYSNELDDVAGLAFHSQTQTPSGNVWPTIISYSVWDPPNVPGGPDGRTAKWAHEIAHHLRHVIGDGEKLPDLDGETGSSGNVLYWDLMGKSAPFVHLSSWSKEKLGWLDYSLQILNDSGYQKKGWLDSLPSLNYGGQAPLLELTKDTHFLLETRISDVKYSRWDETGFTKALVIYQVDGVGYSTVNLSKTLQSKGESYITKFGKKARFTYFSEENGENTFSILVDVEYPYLEPNTTTASLYTASQKATSQESATENFNQTSPDLDLHAYTFDGKHMGINYETGEYEMGITGASTSGDIFQGSEWISVPSDIEVYFVVSSYDTGEFLKTHLGELENENMTYKFEVSRSDENGVTYISPLVNQAIAPGEEIFHDFEPVQNSDGSYSVEVEHGMNLTSLNEWYNAIDNIPVNVFIKNPAQRKNALKEKFEEVFEALEDTKESQERWGDDADEWDSKENRESGEGRRKCDDREEGRGGGRYPGKDLREDGDGDRGRNKKDCEDDKHGEFAESYREAIEKIEHDILEKLDADGEADWTKEPVLIKEIKAFISLLKKGGFGV